MFEPTQDFTSISLLLVLTVLLSLWLEKKFRPLKKIGAAALTIILGMVLSNIGVIPGASPVYDFLQGTGVLAGITLCLLSVSLESIRDAGTPMIKAFALGALGATVGAGVMGYVLASSIGPDSWKLSGQFAATYIGGGVNFAAVGKAVGTSSEYFTAGVAADVIVTAIWLILVIAVPQYMGNIIPDRAARIDAESTGRTYGVAALLNSSGKPITLVDLTVLLSVVLACLWFANMMTELVPAVPMVIWLTTLALVLAQIPAVKSINCGLVIGNFMLLLFLSANGAVSVIAHIVEIGPSIFYFALGTVLIHGIIIFGLGRLLKLDWSMLAIASQANVGGASSAMAISGALKVPHLILPGVAMGLLGTALGNYIGLGLANVMQGIIG